MGDEIGTTTRRERVMVQVRRFAPHTLLLGAGVYFIGLAYSDWTCSGVGLALMVGAVAVIMWPERRAQ